MYLNEDYIQTRWLYHDSAKFPAPVHRGNHFRLIVFDRELRLEVNGVRCLSLSDLPYEPGSPLHVGLCGLFSHRAARLHYRNIHIRKIDQIPDPPAPKAPLQRPVVAYDFSVKPENPKVVTNQTSSDYDTLLRSAASIKLAPDQKLALRTKKDHFALNNFSIDYDHWTVAALVLADREPRKGTPACVITREKNWAINWDHSEGKFRGAAQVCVGDKWHAASFGPLVGGRWYKLVATYDGQALRAYVDGKLITTTPVAGPADPSNAAMIIGRHAWQQGFFTGWIRRTSVYNRVLTEAEVKQLFAKD
ncbi:hypothetical protein HED60_00525 [Planctomycetales bacterium ZRK34]|nr:hypothetical protein HED60_00525 [Planctomycetales bacterium ZRK34]